MKAKDIQVFQSLNYLMYGAFVELMLDTYSNTNQLTYFDPFLLNKHKNLLNDWKRESKKIFDYLEKSGNEEVVKQYHSIVNIFEAIFVKSSQGITEFSELMALIDEFMNGEIKIIHAESK